MGVIEAWRPIPGFPGYEASDLGRVRSWCRLGPMHPAPTEPRIKSASHTGRYLGVTLTRTDGKKVRRYVHHVVLEAFVGPCPEGMEAAHDDDNPLHNALRNLAWKTHQANCDDRARNGGNCFGDRNGSRVHRERVQRGDQHWSRRTPERHGTRKRVAEAQ